MDALSVVASLAEHMSGSLVCFARFLDCLATLSEEHLRLMRQLIYELYKHSTCGCISFIMAFQG